MNTQSRRIIGTLFGLALGLVYGLVSVYINSLMLPGVPIFAPAPGRLTSVAVITLAWGLMGLAAAWPEEGINGMLAGAVVGALISTLSSLPDSGGGTGGAIGAFAVLFVSFFPRAVLFFVLAWLLRKVLHLWHEELITVNFSIRKLALSLLAFLTGAAVMGLLSLYPKEARQALQITDQLLRLNQVASTYEAVPVELKTVDGLVLDARGLYTLEWSDNPDLLPVTRPVASYQTLESLVIVRFENGFVFGCAFTPPSTSPSCGEFSNQR